MDQKLQILLIEDDLTACREISKYIKESEDLTLIGITNDSNEGIQFVKDFMPNAVILDLELHQGAGNGILFLHDLKKLILDFIPYILITTNNLSIVTYENARKLGADFIMAKHQHDYTTKGVIDFLRLMKETILDKSNTRSSHPDLSESWERENKILTRRINIELNHIGISPKAVGYKYLIDAIKLIIQKPENNICSIIAKKYEKTDTSVERAMQNAINKAWRISDIDDLSKFYTARINSERGVPTITEFIFYYANKIRNE